MMYEAYEKRIKKVAHAKNVVIRFKALIIAVISTIIALSTGYVSTKGIVTSEISGPKEIIYGEDFDFSANALFTGVGFEYSVDGVTWTNNVPTTPGTYYVRTVTDKSVGKGYGDPVKITIKPKVVDVTIVEEQIEYGTIPNISAVLIGNDKIVDYDVEFSSIVSNTTSAIVKEGSIIVMNGDEDVTSRYSFNLISKEISYSKKVLDVSPIDYEKVYDGVAIDYSNEYIINAGGIEDGDILDLHTIFMDSASNEVEAPINAGSYDILVDTKNTFVYNNNEVVTNYSLKFGTGKVNIIKRDITILTGSQSFVYNGSSQKYLAADVVEGVGHGLANGHKIVVDDIASVKTITNVGSVDNILTVRILDALGNDVTANYNISYEYGTLEVTPYNITLQTPSASSMYNGLPFQKLDGFGVAESSTIIEGHKVILDETKAQPSISNVGVIENNLALIIVDENNNDVSLNYQITYEYGNLEITQRTDRKSVV